MRRTSCVGTLMGIGLVLLGSIIIGAQEGNPQSGKIPRLHASLLFFLPVKWNSFEIPTLYHRRKPFLHYGPYSFAVHEGHAVFIADDQRHTVIQSDWRGRVENHWKVPQDVGPLSDLVYHNGYLYAGCVKEPRILIFDTRRGTLIGNFSIPRVEGAIIEGVTTDWWIRPIIPRLGVDGKGRIHLVAWAKRGRKLLYLTISRRGKVLSSPTTAIWKAGETDHFDQGVVSLDGEWFYPHSKSVEIETSTYISQYQLWKITLTGARKPFDNLSRVLYGLPGSVRELIGFDGEGNLWAVVTLLGEFKKHGKSVDLGPYLVVWQKGKRQIKGRIMATPGNLRAPGCRHAVVAPSGRIYMLIARSTPLSIGEEVALGLARLK